MFNSKVENPDDGGVGFDPPITIPALLTSLKYGLIAFDVRASIKAEDVSEVQQRQDEIVLAIKAKLLQYRSLTKGSDLAIPINILTYCPEIPSTKGLSTLSVASATTLSNALERSKTLTFACRRFCILVIDQNIFILVARLCGENS